METRKTSTIARFLLAFIAITTLTITISTTNAQSNSRLRPGGTRHRNGERPAQMKDAFYEDNAFVVRIRTSYNNTSSISCNAVVMEDQLVLSDVTCIKYQGMANIDARFVHVLAGEYNNESEYEVEQIYMNKADLRDPGTELALLKLAKPLKIDSQCRHLIKPERNFMIDSESSVRVIGYTKDFELKESRGKSGKRNGTSKYICTSPGDVNDTPGTYLLKGAPLLHMVDCRQYQLVGILAKTESVIETSPMARKHQDCYVVVSMQMRWFDQVKSLTMLKAKNGVTSEPNWWNPIIVDASEQSPEDPMQLQQREEPKLQQLQNEKEQKI